MMVMMTARENTEKLKCTGGRQDYSRRASASYGLTPCPISLTNPGWKVGR